MLGVGLNYNYIEILPLLEIRYMQKDQQVLKIHLML